MHTWGAFTGCMGVVRLMSCVLGLKVRLVLQPSQTQTSAASSGSGRGIWLCSGRGIWLCSGRGIWLCSGRGIWLCPGVAYGCAPGVAYGCAFLHPSPVRTHIHKGLHLGADILHANALKRQCQVCAIHPHIIKHKTDPLLHLHQHSIGTIINLLHHTLPTSPTFH